MVDVTMNVPTVDPGFEVVHFVLGYYDGVLVGIADWHGVPHHFELEDDVAPEGDRRDRYWLTPLAPFDGLNSVGAGRSAAGARVPGCGPNSLCAVVR